MFHGQILGSWLNYCANNLACAISNIQYIIELELLTWINTENGAQ